VLQSNPPFTSLLLLRKLFTKFSWLPKTYCSSVMDHCFLGCFGIELLETFNLLKDFDMMLDSSGIDFEV
jgi:hypothetical protein